MAGAYKLISTPNGRYRFQVVQPKGTPDIPLTLLANELLHSLSDSSIPIYMRAVLALANWMISDPVVLANGWQLFGPPTEVRNLIRQYLLTAAKCKLTTRPDTFGIKVTYVIQTSGTHIQVSLLLTALKHLYELMILKGMYHDPNPLIHEDVANIRSGLLKNYRRAFKAEIGRFPMPSISGVDEPSPHIRLSENYFRYIESEWVPKTIDDPDFPGAIYEAGRKYGWGLREHCIVRTLFEAGPRISEVLSLTALDWSQSYFTNKFRAQNKGSHGVRVKTLVVSSPTSKMYRRYFDDEIEGRRAYDVDRLSVRHLWQLLNKEPERLSKISLYLTGRGTQMSAKLFRDYYWKPALSEVGIDADPHICRHWFVTNALRNIERVSRTENDFQRGKEMLIQYMAWRAGGRTIKAYEHVQRQSEFDKTLQSIHRKMKRREKEFSQLNQTPSKNSEHGHEVATVVDHDLSFLLGEDDDECWAGGGVI